MNPYGDSSIDGNDEVQQLRERVERLQEENSELRANLRINKETIQSLLETAKPKSISINPAQLQGI